MTEWNTWQGRIAGMRDHCMEKGWDSYDAEPMTEETIAMAEAMCKSLMVYPGVMGGFQVCLTLPPHYTHYIMSTPGVSCQVELDFDKDGNLRQVMVEGISKAARVGVEDFTCGDDGDAWPADRYAYMTITEAPK